MKSVLLILVLVIFSSLCLVVHSYEYGVENDQTDENGREGCTLVSKKYMTRMPIPFTTNGPRHSIVYPDEKGRLNVGRGQGFMLSCTTTGRFAASDRLGNASEALVSCVGGDRLWYRGHVYAYEDFRCDVKPKSRLRVTGETCQPENHTVVTVGFQTEKRFLGLYNVCFDKSTKNSLYTWYDVRSPYYDNHQKDSKRPPFIKSKELYGNTDVDKKYTVVEQRKTIAKILKSDELADKYIKSDNKHLLSRGHYAAKADFFFGYEQSATFYFANVAPQWQLFNGDLWNKLEDRTRRALERDDAGNGTGPATSRRRVVVTGTYGSCTLPDVDGAQQPLFLDPPRGIPVPLFYWKLVYDAAANDGLVYVGLNDPYRELDESVYVCPNVCPDGFDRARKNDDDGDGYQSDGGGGDEPDDEDANKGLIYCCTIKSFESVYGTLDPIVFGERHD